MADSRDKLTALLPECVQVARDAIGQLGGITGTVAVSALPIVVGMLEAELAQRTAGELDALLTRGAEELLALRSDDVLELDAQELAAADG